MSNKIKLNKKFQRKVVEIKDKMNQPEKLETPAIIDQLSAFNVINKFGHLLDQGWFIDPDSRKMTCSQGIDWRREWMFVNSDPERCCNLYQEIFKVCNFIPEKCLNCWKVVVKMHTVQQLWDLSFGNPPSIGSPLFQQDEILIAFGVCLLKMWFVRWDKDPNSPLPDWHR